MLRDLQKYIGQTIEIIYIDKQDRITQRKVELRSINGHLCKTFCFHRQAPRSFRVENVLAVTQVKGSPQHGNGA